jgi:murein DD-endopeptidase MepM/ murein hydrolase activator NlpD
MKILLHIQRGVQYLPATISHCAALLAFAALILLSQNAKAASSAANNPLLFDNAFLQLHGNATQGGLLQGKLLKGYALKFNSKNIHIDAQRRFLIGLDRDQDELVTLGVFDHNKPIANYELKIEQRDYPRQHINGVEQKYVEPDPEQVARSKRDSKAVMTARQIQQPEATIWQGFIWPAKGPITGVFGSQRVYNGQPRRPHYGVDVARPAGTPVVAPAAGLITLADDLYFSGHTLIIDHGHGLSSSFLHLSRLHVGVNSRVNQGQVIGEIGATGRVTGAHLDWRMNWTGAGGNAHIDPQLLVPTMRWPATETGEKTF